ncbi:mitotic spindle checkpoint protein BUBR1 [Benincasa hispida]|uniref:mitotic spindle checkpoint protein BUBR1 n=1 Tax=Benincasa hispida TaxID=102211 RepID=UPI0019019286|nr:mitotic spindle checkpoint protein BUBR1 [Benincasa hispida]
MASNDLFSSLISDIKSYSGKDPLLPWLRGIRKMKDSLPSHVLNDKLPRFLQKCTEKFESDRRYRDDLRYLRVWLQLMDYVADPRALLKTMEEKRIGTKFSLFYQAYALYYEKLKKFDDADKMYHLGVQKLAEPIDELQRSYEQFLHRMKRHNYKRVQHQHGRTSRRHLSDKSTSNQGDPEKNNNEVRDKGIFENGPIAVTLTDSRNETEKMPQDSAGRETDEFRIFKSDDMVVKFVDTAFCGKSVAEDACHHGLVEPTVNMKEAMNAINSMFSEPIEMPPIGRRSRGSHSKKDCYLNGGFEVFVDENLDRKIELEKQKGCTMPQHGSITEPHQLEQPPLMIFVDDEAGGEIGNTSFEKDGSKLSESRDLVGGSTASASCSKAFVFPCVDNVENIDDDSDVQDPIEAKFREDTIVCRFVGNAISNEPEVENICHHGLVEPTVNLKEAMDDINNMFGKPIEFVRTRRSKKHEKPPEVQNDFGGFSILPDDELLGPAQAKPPVKSSRKSSDCDLFEPTVFTKEAMDDINKMFGMPLDF